MIKKFVRKLTKAGSHSYVINVPKELVTEFKWREHQKLTLERKGDSVVIKDWKK